MVSSERIDMLPKQRRDMAQTFVIDLITFGPQLTNNLPDLNHVPGNDGVVQNRATTSKGGRELVERQNPFTQKIWHYFLVGAGKALPELHSPRQFHQSSRR
jgi:hypothetical protein